MSCNTNAIPAGATVTSAVLTLHTTSVYGGNNPFLGPEDDPCCGNVRIQVDLVCMVGCAHLVCSQISVANPTTPS